MTRVVERYYPRADFIGGVPGSLDNLHGDILKDSDMAIVINGDYFAPYFCDYTGGAAETSPQIIVPDTNPGDINWLLRHALLMGLTLYSDPTAGNQVGDRDYNDLRYSTLLHASQHQNGGSDEINVGGLSGVLADNQNPTAHAVEHVDGTDDIQNATAVQKGLATAAQITKLDGVEALADVTGSNAPQAHSTSHQNGGSDEINVAGLSGVLADNQPPAAHAAEHTDGTDDIQNATAVQKGLATAAQITKLDGIEALADVTDSTNVNAAGAVMETDYNAQTVLGAILDNTPTAIAFAASTIMGRTAAGDIDALTVAEVITLLNSGSGLDADTLDTFHAATAAAASTIPVQDANGDLRALRYFYCTYANMSHAVTTRSSETRFASSTNSFLRWNNKTGMLASLNVADGADVTGSNAPQAHDTSHQNGGSDEINVGGLSGLLADDQHVLDAEVKAIKLDDFSTPDDNTDLDATTTEHGLLRKLDNDVTHFLNGQGGWTIPAATGAAVMVVGTYTGNGGTSYAITGLGIAPLHLQIFKTSAWSYANDQVQALKISTSTLAYGPQNYTLTGRGRIISLDSDGFTVGDNAQNADPNKASVVYRFVAFG